MSPNPDPSGYPVFSVAGDRYIFLVTGAQSGGAYAVLEAHVPPGGGPPTHLHRREDESFQVIKGEFEFTVDGTPVRVGPGEFLFARRDVPHRFKNVGTTPGRMLITLAPAGLKVFFGEIGTRRRDRNETPIPPTADDIARLLHAAPNYGLEIPAAP